jgi:hypothetical protein
LGPFFYGTETAVAQLTPTERETGAGLQIQAENRRVNDMRLTKMTQVRISKSNKRRKYRPFPYQRVAKMWAKGMTIAGIARAINRVDKDNLKDPYHSLRNFLYRMHNFIPYRR